MTPATTQVRIEELQKRDLTIAWQFAMMNMAGKGKNFPKSPDALWGGKSEAPRTPMSAMVEYAKQRMAAKERDKAKKAASAKVKK